MTRTIQARVWLYSARTDNNNVEMIKDKVYNIYHMVMEEGGYKNNVINAVSGIILEGSITNIY
jgi:hypothetical protein